MLVLALLSGLCAVSEAEKRAAAVPAGRLLTPHGNALRLWWNVPLFA
jgi:hypothetical protein